MMSTERNNQGCSVIISYSRKDRPFVRHLYDAIQDADLNNRARDPRQIYVDWDDVSSIKTVFEGIERSDVLIFVLSPDSIEQEQKKMELNHAVELGKRIVPVVCREVDFSKVFSALAPLHWIFFKEEVNQDFKKATKLLIQALDREIIHAKYHTVLLNLALKWERADFEKSLLLQKNDVQTGKHWISASALGKEPKPTPLHLSYITASDALHTSMAKRRLIALFFLFIVLIGIIWPSWGVFFYSLIFSHFFVFFASS